MVVDHGSLCISIKFIDYVCVVVFVRLTSLSLVVYCSLFATGF